MIYKWTRLHPLLIMCLRSMLQWLFALAACTLRACGKPNGEHYLGPRNVRRILLLRALAFYAFMLLWWSSVQSLPLGDATGIVYTWPLLTAAWGLLCLREQVGGTALLSTRQAPDCVASGVLAAYASGGLRAAHITTAHQPAPLTTRMRRLWLVAGQVVLLPVGRARYLRAALGCAAFLVCI